MDKSAEKISLVKDLVSKLLEKIGIEFSKVVVEEKFDTIFASVESSEAALLIGVQGKNLDALQNVLKSMLFKHFPDEKVFLVVDVEQFRKKRFDRMLEIAKEKAQAVRETRIAQVMPPMSPFMRRMLHIEFQNPEFADIETSSAGEGTDRRVHLSFRNNDLED